MIKWSLLRNQREQKMLRMSKTEGSLPSPGPKVGGDNAEGGGGVEGGGVGQTLKP